MWLPDWLRNRFCKHNGPMHFVYAAEMFGVPFTLWRCDRCGAEVFTTDE